MPSDSRRFPKQLGKTERESRLVAQLTQTALAEKANLNLNYVGEIKRGEKMESLETIVRVGTALGISSADLLRQSGL